MEENGTSSQTAFTATPLPARHTLAFATPSKFIRVGLYNSRMARTPWSVFQGELPMHIADPGDVSQIWVLTGSNNGQCVQRAGT